MNDENQAIGWDEEINPADIQQNKKESVLLPDGEYDFDVKKVERGQFNGSTKLPPCNMVTVGMVFKDAFHGEAYISIKFFMVKKTLWKIYEFLTAIGLHKPGAGATGPIPWGKVDMTCSGRAKLTHRSYVDGNGVTKTVNDVAEFIAPAAPVEDAY